MIVGLNSGWFKTRWLEFRTGYSTYLTFIFAFSNFLLIAYGFIPQFKDAIPFHYFAIVFGIIIVPVAILVGHNHNKKQLPADSKVSADHNPYRDIIQPKSKEELGNKFNLFNIAMTIWNQKFNIFSQKVTLFGQRQGEYNLDHAIWALEGTIWNYKKAIKDMMLHNQLVDKFNLEIPKFDKELNEADVIIGEAKERHSYLTGLLNEYKTFKETHIDNLKGLEGWNEVLIKWQEIYEKLQKGESVNDINVPE